MPLGRHLRASYDADGNIILSVAMDGAALLPSLPGTTGHITVREEETDFLAEEDRRWMRADDAIVISEEQEESVTRFTEEIEEEISPERSVTAHLSAVSAFTRSAVQEGIRQYAVSLSSGGPLLDELGSDARFSLRRLCRFLTQPVWVPQRKNSVKQYSRGSLFAIDIVRFGTTFACIFGVLFLALNYQSFWQIGSAQLDHFLSGPAITAPSLNAGTDTVGASTQADDARNQGDLLSYLPDVGPPDNRIVIPKLHLNVPLVNPSYDALLRQDWTQVESDIQQALQAGVVHYPGTAKPGQAGNFFVTGHSSYYPWASGEYKTVFARLHELDAGDEFTVYYGGDQHRYIIRSKKEVPPTDVTVLDQPPDARIATLMTCTPVGTTLRRLIVRAEEVDLKTGQSLQVGQRGDEQPAKRPQLDALPI